MKKYKIQNDGKLHTRYSELTQCTDAGIVRVLQLRAGEVNKFSSASTEFGSIRHEMFEEDVAETGNVPEVFTHSEITKEEVRATGRTPYEYQFLIGSLPVTHCEQSFATELFPGVVIHFTPDEVAADIQTIIDTKTMIPNEKGKVQPNKYLKSNQLKLYALLLRPHGITINKGLFLIEQWDREYKEITDYHVVPQKIGLIEMGEAQAWAAKRVDILKAGIEWWNSLEGTVKL